MKKNEISSPAGCVLAINSAEGVLQLVLGDAGSGRLLGAASQEASACGVERLTPLLAHLLADAGRTQKDMVRIACVRGPGSFTGLRLGLASAFGLARGCGALLAGLDYLPLLARTVLTALPAGAPLPDGPLWAILHARRTEVVLQGFSPRLDPLTPALVRPVEELGSWLSAWGAPGLIFGSGAVRHRQELARWFSEKPLFSGDACHLAPAALLAAALQATYGPHAISPLYVRDCDAQENLVAIAQRMGRDPAQARQALERLTHTEIGDTGAHDAPCSIP